uniref:Uncharacterized protein n=1 Tax=Cajanus cajan TaxID=3821 RepID=A0A151R652_CAJCA|nr:hypothetical protein KK1_040690 [Cajanus cajan]
MLDALPLKQPLPLSIGTILTNNLNLFYLFLAILILINFFAYLFVSKGYKYRPQDSIVTGDNSKE